MMRNALIVALVPALAGCAPLPKDWRPPPPTAPITRGLIDVYHVQPICNGITITPDGKRSFVSLPKPDGGGGATLCEIAADSSLTPYPDIAWNDWHIGEPADKKFVRVNSLRIGPDGLLWLVDIGSPGGDTAVVPGGPKLVAIDLSTDQVVRAIPLDSVVKPKSFIDDVRFGNRNFYITDAGEPALIVLDPQTGHARRVLENEPSTTSRDMYAEGKLLTKPNGERVKTHADQLELTADGSLLYFMPCSGPCSKIETKYLDDPSLSPKELASHVQPFYDNPTIGGTAIDAAGNLYFDDVDHQQVTRVSPDGHPTTIVQDKNRLHWGDAMWIDHAGNLWIPAAQINRSAGMNGGLLKVEYPCHIYRIQIGAQPVMR